MPDAQGWKKRNIIGGPQYAEFQRWLLVAKFEDCRAQFAKIRCGDAWRTAGPLLPRE
jgi:hypothetical protein